MSPNPSRSWYSGISGVIRLVPSANSTSTDQMRQTRLTGPCEGSRIHPAPPAVRAQAEGLPCVATPPAAAGPDARQDDRGRRAPRRARSSARWASSGTLASSVAPAARWGRATRRAPAHLDRDAPPPAAARLRPAWLTARGLTSRASTGPRPRAAQAWASRPDPQPASTAGPAGQRLERREAHRGRGVIARPEALAGGLDQLTHPRRGRQVAGLRRYQPAIIAAGGSGQPGTSSSGWVGKGHRRERRGPPPRARCGARTRAPRPPSAPAGAGRARRRPPRGPLREDPRRAGPGAARPPR